MGGRLKALSGVGALAIGALALSACFPPAPGPANLSLSPNPMVFNSVATPVTAPYSWMPQVQVTVTNTGGQTIANLAVTGVQVSSVPSDSCSTTLGPGQSCTAMIQYCPNASTLGLDQQMLVVTGTDASTGGHLHTTQLEGWAA